jgi:hypothetical protein
MQKAVTSRRTARSPAKPEKTLLLWSLFLGGKSSALTQVAIRWEGKGLEKTFRS